MSQLLSALDDNNHLAVHLGVLYSAFLDSAEEHDGTITAGHPVERAALDEAKMSWSSLSSVFVRTIAICRLLHVNIAAIYEAVRGKEIMTHICNMVDVKMALRCLTITLLYFQCCGGLTSSLLSSLAQAQINHSAAAGCLVKYYNV